jgi:hypothetical protein
VATIASPLSELTLRRPARGVLIVLACLASATTYAAMRAPVTDVILSSYARTCTRTGLRADEWLCGTSRAQVLAAFVVGSLLVGAGIALPCVVLALSGRRVGAFAPLAVAFVTAVVSVGRTSYLPTQLFGIPEGWPGTIGRDPLPSFWQTHPVFGFVADLVIVSLPVLAFVRWSRTVSVNREPPSRRGATFASVIVLAAIGVIGWVSGWLVEMWGPGLVMATFGILLGTDRRWWPWVLAPVAVLLSLGPAMAVISTITQFPTLAWFRSVVPLVAIGLAGSSWRPLALAFSRVPPDTREARAAIPRQIRPVAVANAVAVGLVIVSFLAYRYDPLPIHSSEVLPSYLGARELTQDVRAKTNLYVAIGAMRDYRAATGTFAGFDAAEGEAAAASLAWTEVTTTDPLVVRVTLATENRAQVVTTSGSGTAFCLRSEGGSVTMGEANTIPAARRGCDAVPWSSRELATIDFDELCDEAPASSVMICRAVQRYIDEILATPTL